MINLTSFEKPQRYIGKEINSITNKKSKTKFLLAYPDVYEIGISHFGSRILYESINYLSPYSMERAYMPWKDLYSYMKEHNKLLCSIESNTPLKDFSAIGFSTSSELSFTNILAMIDLAGLEVYREKRKNTDPLIILGGIASFNPSPLLDFIDVFVIGEADYLIQDILKILDTTVNKNEKLERLAKLDGVYIPSLNYNKKIKKVFLKSIDEFPLIKHPLIPITDAVHDRITYEIQRGCNRGCRFCQAGMIYKPLRQRSASSILSSIEEDLNLSGYRNIGFLSLNACDYAPLISLIDYIYENYKNKGISVSLPSLRIESINENFLNILSKLPKGGFTIAPEVASLKLKKTINKNIDELEILETVKTVSKLGWNSIKAYFMLGLPGEEKSDLDAIIELSYKMLNNLSSFRQSITVNLSNFIPKTHTPFQWCKQDNHVETKNKLDFFISNLKNKRINLKWTDAKLSEIEGLLSRADEKLGVVLYSLYKAGEIFTAWGHFNYELWLDTLKKHKLDINQYLASRESNLLAWDNIDTGVSKAYLLKEFENSKNQILTKDCTASNCSSCGICNDKIFNIVRNDFTPLEISQSKVSIKLELVQKIRFRFIKHGVLKYLSHFEVMNIIEKASIRAALPVLISAGFNPSLKISYGPALNYGLESDAELADFNFYQNVDINNVIASLNKTLPEGLKFLEGYAISLNSRSINSSIERVYFRIAKNELKDFKLKTDNFTIDNNIFNFKKISIEKKAKLIDVNSYINIVEYKEDSILISINYDAGKSIKIFDFLNLMFEDIDTNKINIIKRGIKVDGNYYGS